MNIVDTSPTRYSICQDPETGHVVLSLERQPDRYDGAEFAMTCTPEEWETFLATLLAFVPEGL